MSGTVPSSQTSEDENEAPVTEQEVQKAQEQVLQEEVPEMGMGNYMLQFVGALGLLHVSKRAKVIDAFKQLKNPYLQYHLLQTQHPDAFQNVQRQLEEVEKEFERQKKGNKGKDPEKVKVGFGRLSQTMTYDELQRRKQAFGLASVTQTKINIDDINKKYEHTKSLYGLSDDNYTKLKSSYADWAKKNKGRTFDDYLLVEGRKLYLSQNNLSEKQINAKTRKKQIEEHEKSLHRARREAVQENKDVRLATHKAVQDALNPNTPLLTPEQFQFQQTQVLSGQYKKNEPFVRHPQQAGQPSQSIPPAQKISLPGISSFQSKISDFFKRSAALQFARTAMRNAIASSLMALRGAGLRSVAKLGLSFARSALPFLFKTASRVAITAGGAVASLGTTLLMQAGLEILKKIPGIGKVAQLLDDAIMGLIKYAALFAIGVPVAILLLFILGLSNSNIIPSFSSQDAILVASPQTAVYSWHEFEKTFLAQTKSWSQFVKENLVPSKMYLSSELKIRN